MKRAARITLLALPLLLAGCRLGHDSNQVKRPRQPSVTSERFTNTATAPPTATRAAVPDSGWQQLRPGLERRVINHNADEDGTVETLYILRIDPALFRFDVGYHPGAPLSLDQWQEESEALIVVNGGFFTDSFEATGLTVANGTASGVSYDNFGGMLAITAGGPQLRWLSQQPYDSTEPLLAGLQSFPVLIRPGGQIGVLNSDGEPARRTVIGQDRDGRMLLVIAASGSFTLGELSQYLAGTDLGLDIALNLDGGASTGLLLAEPAEGIASFSLLPAVITVHPK